MLHKIIVGLAEELSRAQELGLGARNISYTKHESPLELTLIVESTRASATILAFNEVVPKFLHIWQIPLREPLP